MTRLATPHPVSTRRLREMCEGPVGRCDNDHPKISIFTSHILSLLRVLNRPRLHHEVLVPARLSPKAWQTSSRRTERFCFNLNGSVCCRFAVDSPSGHKRLNFELSRGNQRKPLLREHGNVQR